MLGSLASAIFWYRRSITRCGTSMASADDQHIKFIIHGCHGTHDRPCRNAPKRRRLTDASRQRVKRRNLLQQIYFMVDTPSGKLEIRIPLTPKSLAGAAILHNELINIPVIT